MKCQYYKKMFIKTIVSHLLEIKMSYSKLNVIQ